MAGHNDTARRADADQEKSEDGIRFDPRRMAHQAERPAELDTGCDGRIADERCIKCNMG